MSILTSEPNRLSQSDYQLSDDIIPAVLGEFYVYSTKFSNYTPLQVFMKCKANKNRMISELGTLGQEANLYWNIHDRRVLSVKEALRQNHIESSISWEDLCDTWIAHTNLSPEQFYAIANQRNEQVLKQECLLAFTGQKTKAESLQFEQYQVIASITNHGKYCLFLIMEVGDIVQIDACHILLD